jgi:hypothetical protein
MPSSFKIPTIEARILYAASEFISGFSYYDTGRYIETKFDIY